MCSNKIALVLPICSENSGIYDRFLMWLQMSTWTADSKRVDEIPNERLPASVNGTISPCGFIQ